MTLGEIIKEFRNQYGMSQRAFAKKAGIANTYISILEKDINPSTGKPTAPTVAVIESCARAMGLTFEELLNKMSGEDIITFVNEEPDTPLPDDEIEILKAYRALPSILKPLALKTLQSWK